MAVPDRPDHLILQRSDDRQAAEAGGGSDSLPEGLGARRADGADGHSGSLDGLVTANMASTPSTSVSHARLAPWLVQDLWHPANRRLIRQALMLGAIVEFKEHYDNTFSARARLEGHPEVSVYGAQTSQHALLELGRWLQWRLG